VASSLFVYRELAFIASDSALQNRKYEYTKENHLPTSFFCEVLFFFLSLVCIADPCVLIKEYLLNISSHQLILFCLFLMSLSASLHSRDQQEILFPIRSSILLFLITHQRLIEHRQTSLIAIEFFQIPNLTKMSSHYLLENTEKSTINSL